MRSEVATDLYIIGFLMLKSRQALRKNVVSAFNGASNLRPKGAVVTDHVETLNAKRLVNYVPAWVTPDEDIFDYRYGIDALSLRGLRFILGRLLIYCIDHPNSEVCDALIVFLGHTAPSAGKTRKMQKILSPLEARLLFQVVQWLSEERSEENYNSEDLMAAIEETKALASI